MKASKHLAGVAQLHASLSLAGDSDELIAMMLEGAKSQLGFEHTAVMLVDERGDHLFTVATHGFTPSGVGSEQRIGDGLWGKVAERRAPLRIVNLGRELHYASAVRKAAVRAGDERLTRQIELPGLAAVESVLAIPLVAGSELLGVVGAQSIQRMAFDADDENALTIVALAAAMRLAALRELADPSDAPPAGNTSSQEMVPSAKRIVRYYRADDSVFVDHDYVIKGLPGRVLWLLLCEHANGRSLFTNRELRVSPSLKLSEIRANLESRLILLRNRLDEKACGIRIAKRGRGQFAVEIAAQLELIEVTS